MQILMNMDLCYGCGACANKCPKDAISMKAASDGFLFPDVDDTKCIQCNLCRKVCPQLNPHYENNAKPEVYAVMAADNIRAKSASGGAFSVLADYAFSKNGYVCGAVFTEDFRGAKHIMIDKNGNLDALRRSKYIQSDSGNIYVQVQEKLNNGNFVLFVGTPCQCAALKSFLQKPYENLLIVDLICHGTPSPLAWNKFLDEIAPGQALKDVNFRYKGVIGWSATTHVEFKNGKEYTELFKKCNFEQASSKNLISRKSCGTCQFARVPRQGDITIGDFWGINKFDKQLDDRKGTSAILINTEKGAQIVNAVSEKNQFLVRKQVPFYEAFSRNNSNIYRYPHSHPGRQHFFNLLESGIPFSSALAQSKTTKYDIMLFSIWYAANFGSMMTNFALYKTLEDMGYNCIFADIPDHLWTGSRVHRDPLFITRRFGYKHFKLTGKYKNRTDLKKVNELADTFIIGSDQIWNYNLCKSADTFFYLDFVDDDKRKIAYGTSFGHKTFTGGNEARKRAGFYLNRFDAVSVREDYAVDLCRDDFGVESVQVLDPVFMCDKSHYLRCIEESKLSQTPIGKKYVLAYILDPTEEKQAALEYAAKRLDADIVCIPNAHVKDDMRSKWRLPILENIDMEDWLYYFKNAEMVITDSFHGSCFSLIFEKPFIAIGNKRRGLERFYSLLEGLGLIDRLVLSADEIHKNDALFTNVIDYNTVNDQLDILRQNSMQWLKSALQTSKRKPVFSAYDLADRRMDSLIRDFDKKLSDVSQKYEAELVRVNAELSELKLQNEEYKDKINKLERKPSISIFRSKRK